MSSYENLSNVEHYDSPTSFTNLLTIMKVGENEQSHLADDGFIKLRDIVEYFERSNGSQIKSTLRK